MKPRRAAVAAWGTAAVASSLMACDPGSGSNDLPGSPDENTFRAADLAGASSQPVDPLPADWAGFAMGVVPPTFEYLSAAHLDENGELVVVDVAAIEARAATSRDDDSIVEYILVDAVAGGAWAVVYQRDELDRLVTGLEAVGFNLPFGADSNEGDGGSPQDSTPEDPSQVLETWSDNADTRTPRVAPGTPLGGAGSWPARAVGDMGNDPGGCTGTLVGKATVITAAHCVYSKWCKDNVPPVNGYNTPFFKARRDPSSDAPYGNATVNAWWIPTAYLGVDANCDAVTACGTDIQCNQYDIAAVRISAQVGVSTGGWGYGAISKTDLDSYPSKFMMGYPVCNGGPWPNANPQPASSCKVSGLYMDTQHCGGVGTDYALGVESSVDPDGWARETTFGCDGSAGMSGSALYTTNSQLNLGNPIAFGIYSGALCVPPGCPVHYENVMTRITLEYAAAIFSNKALWGG